MHVDDLRPLVFYQRTELSNFDGFFITPDSRHFSLLLFSRSRFQVRYDELKSLFMFADSFCFHLYRSTELVIIPHWQAFLTPYLDT